mmetsp:Transcript_56466/g.123474  ORF Transcript_56466/g.123474 Transcript_56466/m.123474 type:complete len:214 (+) Transcript_56466:1174-1815(+)
MEQFHVICLQPLLTCIKRADASTQLLCADGQLGEDDGDVVGTAVVQQTNALWLGPCPRSARSGSWSSSTSGSKHGIHQILVKLKLRLCVFALCTSHFELAKDCILLWFFTTGLHPVNPLAEAREFGRARAEHALIQCICFWPRRSLWSAFHVPWRRWRLSFGLHNGCLRRSWRCFHRTSSPGFQDHSTKEQQTCNCSHKARARLRPMLNLHWP